MNYPDVNSPPEDAVREPRLEGGKIPVVAISVLYKNSGTLNTSFNTTMLVSTGLIPADRSTAIAPRLCFAVAGGKYDELPLQSAAATEWILCGEDLPGVLTLRFDEVPERPCGGI